MTRHAGLANLRETGQRCLSLTGVQAADVLTDDSRTESHVLELTVGPGYDRVPPRVIRVLAECDVGVYDTTPRPDGHFTVLAV
jgi:hypothetical protein